MRTPFDPRKHVRQLDDGREYLDLKWRLVWLRTEHPEAQIESEIVANGEPVICRASISLQNGARATGHGSSDPEAGDNLVEDAEDRALLRALSALGYGTEFADDSDQDSHVAAPTKPVELKTARALMEESAQPADYTPEPEPAPPSETEAPKPMRGSDVAEETEASNISWTKFWEWARDRGYRNASELSEMLGVEDVRAFTPREVRRMVKKYELEHPPSGPEGDA